jgi:hypothetical protein
VSRPVVFIVATAAAITIAAALFIARRPAPRVDSPEAPAAEDVATRAPSAPASSPAVTTPDAARPAPRRPSAGAAPAPAPEDTPAAPPVAAAPVTGVLTIQSDVPGAQVFIDRKFIGSAPVTIDDVQPGSHQLNVSADGFDGIARTIEVEPGPRDITVRFREVRLSAALPVVHRHRIGSCTGRLVASADGLRYETANKDDAFSVAFGDLEAFEVNYQERNLRLKVRKGRDYNFTDPEKDADRLFVFHRDVERARGLLAKGYQPASD